MTVLVDEARWPWRGRRWAHMVSDSSYDELHGLAQAIGKRRLGFQGDHYDVDEVDRHRALALGAVPVSSRELVYRLRMAGLRCRVGKVGWERLAVSRPGDEPHEIIAMLDRLGPGGPKRLSVAIGHLGSMTRACDLGLYGHDRELVLLVDLGPQQSVVLSQLAHGSVDSVWSSGPRVDGTRSLELFVSR